MTNNEIDKMTKDRLQKLSKNTIIELYLQAMFDKKVADNQIKELEEQNKTLNVNLIQECKEHQEFCKETKTMVDELQRENSKLERALTYACDELDDAKDMLRDAGKYEWASLLNTSEDYFKLKAEEIKEIKNEK